MVASAYPEEFLATLGHDDKWIRIQAAAALRGHRHRGLRSVLLAATEDPEDLVRYHVEERLAELDG